MDDVLIGGEITENEHFTELRSMAIGQHKGEEVLFVADGASGSSSILVYSTCDAVGHRLYMDKVVTTAMQSGADHTYGLCFDHENNIYASFQHTDSVLRFSKDTFTPMFLPMSLRGSKNLRPYYPGTFVQFGQPKLHSLNEQGVRSIAVIHNNLWIANQNINGIAIYSLTTGSILNVIPMVNPIGIHYSREAKLVFVGSKQKHWQAAVYGIDPHTFITVRTYSTGRMDHPTGITSFGDDLFVAEIEAGQILRFKISTAEFLGAVVSDAPGEIEQLILSDC